MLPFLIGAGLGLLGSLLAGSSRPNVQTVTVPKPREYTDLLSMYLGQWTTDKQGNRVFKPAPYARALLQAQEYYKSLPVVSLGGVKMPALGLLNAYGKSLSPLIRLGQEVYYPLQVNQIASPSFGQMLGGAMMGAGNLALGFGLRNLLGASGGAGAGLGGGSFGIDFDPTLDPFG